MTWVPGEKLIIRIWETCERTGIGLIAPWQIRREGRAHSDVRREELLQDAQTRKDVEAILAGRAVLGKNSELLPTPAPDPQFDKSHEVVALPDRSRSTLNILARSNAIGAAEKAEQLLNLRQIVAKAEEVAQSDPDQSVPPPERPTTDWFSRWREGAERTTLEELQDLWARLLVGEIKSPGSFSLRTVELLKTFGQHEAKLIAKIAPLVINDQVVFKGQAGARKHPNAVENSGIQYQTLLELQELGFFHEVQGIGSKYEMTIDMPGMAVRFQGGVAVVITLPPGGSPKIFSVASYPVTRVGREILRLGKFDAPPDQYVSEFMRVVEQEGLSVKRGRITSGDGTHVVFDEAPP